MLEYFYYGQNWIKTELECPNSEFLAPRNVFVSSLGLFPNFWIVDKTEETCKKANITSLRGRKIQCWNFSNFEGERIDNWNSYYSKTFELPAEHEEFFEKWPIPTRIP